MNILLIDNGSVYITELKHLLGNNLITHVKMNSANVASASHYDLIILSGGHNYAAVNHEHIYSQELEIIRKCNRPIIGICLGFQLISYAFGGWLKHLDNHVHGLRQIEFTPGAQELFNVSDTMQVYERHQWSVESVPAILEVLATSTDGIEAVKHVLKPIYGFQFHPEVHKKHSVGDELFLSVFKEIEERVNAE